jgi:hypothetical protein
MSDVSRAVSLLLLATLMVLLIPNTALAYIGPGAGFALAGSLMAVMAAVASAVVGLLTWPIRLLFQALGHHASAHLAGGVVDIPDRRQSRQAQYLRLSCPGPSHLSAEAQFRGDPA